MLRTPEGIVFALPLAGPVSRLLAWSVDLGEGNSATNPIEVDGTLYVATGFGVVRAIDAVSGKVLWLYDAKAPEQTSNGSQSEEGEQYLPTDRGKERPDGPQRRSRRVVPW